MPLKLNVEKGVHRVIVLGITVEAQAEVKGWIHVDQIGLCGWIVSQQTAWFERRSTRRRVWIQFLEFQVQLEKKRIMFEGI